MRRLVASAHGPPSTSMPTFSSAPASVPAIPAATIPSAIPAPVAPSAGSPSAMTSPAPIVRTGALHHAHVPMLLAHSAACHAHAFLAHAGHHVLTGPGSRSALCTGPSRHARRSGAHAPLLRLGACGPLRRGARGLLLHGGARLHRAAGRRARSAARLTWCGSLLGHCVRCEDKERHRGSSGHITAGLHGSLLLEPYEIGWTPEIAVRSVPRLGCDPVALSLPQARSRARVFGLMCGARQQHRGALGRRLDRHPHNVLLRDRQAGWDGIGAVPSDEGRRS